MSNQPIVLQAEIKITKIKKKVSGAYGKGLEVGDNLIISHIIYDGQGSRGKHAARYDIYRPSTNMQEPFAKDVSARTMEILFPQAFDFKYIE